MTKKTIVSVMLLLAILTTAQGQTKDATVRDIGEKFRRINSDSGYLIKTLENEQFLEHMTDGGGILTGYFKNGQIKKITERVGLSYCIKTFEFYFWDGQLIFVYEKEEDFPYIEATGSLDLTKLELAFEGRYYFDNGKLIETKMKGKKRIADDIGTDIAKELLAIAKQNMDALKRQRNTR